MSKGLDRKIKNTDNILSHFILLGMLLVDAAIQVFLLITNLRTKNKKQDKEESKLQETENILREKSSKELRELLTEIDVISSLNTDELIQVILNNSEAKNRLNTSERRKELMMMTNEELKLKLKGVDGVSRLRKTELVQYILEEEKK